MATETVIIEVDVKTGKASQQVAQVGEKLKSQVAGVGKAVESNNNLMATSARFLEGRFGLVGESLTRIVGITKDLTKGMTGVKAAIAATGIGLLVVAIGVLATKMDDMKAALRGLDGAQVQLNKSAEEGVKIADKQLDILNGQDNVLRLQGKSEAEIIKLKQVAIEEDIDAYKFQLERQKATIQFQIDAEARNKKILSGIIDFMVKPLQLLIDYASKASELLGFEGFEFNIGEKVAGLLFDPEAVDTEANAAIEATEKKLLELTNTQAGYELKLKEIKTKAADENNAIAEKEAAELLRIRKEGEDAWAKIEAEAKAKRDADAKALFDREQQALADIESVRLALVTDAQQKEQDAVAAKYDALFLMANNNAELEKQLLEQQVMEAEAIKKKYSDIELAREQSVRNAKLQMAQDALGAISDLTTAFGQGNEKAAKRAFQINKAASIAQAVISTYQGISNIFATSAANPASVLFPGYPYIQAGIAGIAGFARVAKIKSTQFGGGGGGGGASGGGGGGFGGGGGVTPPTQGPVPNQPDFSSILQTPKTYVLGQDVTNEQQIQNQIAQKSKL